MSREHHAVKHHSHEKEPNSDFIVANLSKETAAGTLHALSELQELSHKDPKAFAKVLAKVNEKVDTSFLTIDKNGASHGDLEIVGFDKCGSLIMKDKSTDELFDPRVNLKNGILEIRRPLMQSEVDAREIMGMPPLNLAPVENRDFRPAKQQDNFELYETPARPAASSQIEYTY